jgi:peptidoglycan-associated lipoprotein
MTNRILVLIVALGLLAACETASQNVGAGTGASASSSSDNQIADELLRVGDTVLFDYDSSSLSDDAKATLSAQAAFLSANPSVTILVQGHCDERGTREYNLALGERRASSARDYLVAQGVDSARIKIISYGKERPAFIGSNPYAYSKNRRALSVIN